MNGELSEGIYVIPDQLRGVVYGNEIHIFPRKALNEYRCKDCVHREEGYATINAYRKSWICKQRPKEILNPMFSNQIIFYAAPYYGKPCGKFKLKGGEK